MLESLCYLGIYKSYNGRNVMSNISGISYKSKYIYTIFLNVIYLVDLRDRDNITVVELYCVVELIFYNCLNTKKTLLR